MTVEEQIRLYAEAITVDAPARIARAMDAAADPLAREEQAVPADGSVVTVLPPGRSGGVHRRPNRAVWWTVAAAAAVLVATFGVATFRHGTDAPSVETPEGRVTPDSYPDPGVECGGSRLVDAVPLAGRASAEVCIGTPAEGAGGAQTVYVTSDDGARILGGWVLTECPDYSAGGSAQLAPGDDDGPVLVYGMVEPSTAAVQYVLSDGTAMTAETLSIEGIDQTSFYAVVLPANPRVVDRRAFGGNGAEIESPPTGCTPRSGILPDEAVTAIAKGLIDETSAAMGVEVGDPCSAIVPTGGGLPMVALIAGNVHDDTCHIIGWSPVDVPGILTSTQFDQDGNVIYRTPPPPPGPDDPGDGLAHGPTDASPQGTVDR